MKRFSTFILLAATALVLMAGCRHPLEKVDLTPGPDYAGDWLTRSDVLRIAHALNVSPDSSPVHWDNDATGYQYSMSVFHTGSGTAKAETVREFTVLSTAPDGTAEVLNLRGRSHSHGEWDITADNMPTRVGKATRLHVASSDTPRGTVSSGDHFHGFMVVKK